MDALCCYLLLELRSVDQIRFDIVVPFDLSAVYNTYQVFVSCVDFVFSFIYVAVVLFTKHVCSVKSNGNDLFTH